MFVTTEEFIVELMSNYELNKAQLELFGLSYPPEDGWDNLIVNKKIDKRTYELLILLKGDISQKAQKQIIKNYELLKTLDNQSCEAIDISNIQEQKSNNSNRIKIYCDGACFNNPGPAGSGISIYNKDGLISLYYGDYTENGTNNIAELNALKKSFEIALEEQSDNIIEIYSDSRYSIDCITKWANNWKRNGWTKKDGEIKNLQLIQSCYSLYEKIKNKIVLNHVKGHSGIEGNELADRMAVYAIKAKSEKYSEYLYENVSDILQMS